MIGDSATPESFVTTPQPQPGGYSKVVFHIGTHHRAWRLQLARPQVGGEFAAMAGMSAWLQKLTHLPHDLPGQVTARKFNVSLYFDDRPGRSESATTATTGPTASVNSAAEKECVCW